MKSRDEMTEAERRSYDALNRLYRAANIADGIVWGNVIRSRFSDLDIVMDKD